MKCLTHIILTSTKAKERDKAITIKKLMETLDFVYAGCSVPDFANCQYFFDNYCMSSARHCELPIFLRKVCSVIQ